MKSNHLNPNQLNDTDSASNGTGPGNLQKTARRQRGFTLIELSIVIAIGLLLILAGLKFGPTLMRGTRVQSETQNIGGLKTAIGNLYRGQYNPPAQPVSNANIINFGLAPQDLLDAGGGLTGHWGTVTVTPSNLAGGVPGTAMQIALINIPQDVCVQLAPSLVALADEMDVGGAAVKNQTALLNPTAAAVAFACGNVGGGTTTITIRAL
jgi:prepilin-type N-terminal cleavage/methylation domain-containing protein